MSVGQLVGPLMDLSVQQLQIGPSSSGLLIKGGKLNFPVPIGALKEFSDENH